MSTNNESSKTEQKQDINDVDSIIEEIIDENKININTTINLPNNTPVNTPVNTPIHFPHLIHLKKIQLMRLISNLVILYIKNKYKQIQININIKIGLFIKFFL